MPASRQFLVEGYDPTLDSCVPISTLLQMFRASGPHTDVGYIVSAEESALPDVTTYPELARFLVRGLSGGTPTGNIYFYNGTSWQLISAILNMPDGSISAAKLAPSGFSYYVWANNAGATEVVPTPITTILNAATLAVDPNATSQYFLEKRSGSFLLSGVNGAGIWYKSIGPDKLGVTGAAAGYVLTFDSTTSEAKWAAPAGSSPTGPAGGDLANNYPNPTIKATGVAAGTYGGSNAIPVLTINAKGQVTAASEAASSTNYAKIIHTEPTGTEGYFATGGVFILNNVQYESTAGFVVLASNTFELQPGTYEITLVANLWATDDGKWNVILYDGSNNVIDWRSAQQNDAGDSGPVYAGFTTFVTIASPTTFYYKVSSTTDLYGVGYAVNQVGFAERYTQVLIKQLS